MSLCCWGEELEEYCSGLNQHCVRGGVSFWWSSAVAELGCESAVLLVSVLVLGSESESGDGL